jgi:Fe-S-cluster containining protein
MEGKTPETGREGETDLASSCRKALEGLLRDIHAPVTLREVWPRLEADPLYREAKKRWTTLTVSQRGRVWEDLCRKMERVAYDTRPYCLRCGECCRRGSPTLVGEDLPILKQGKISRLELLTLRQGEIGFSNEQGEPVLLQEERIKIREKPGTRECLFYEAAVRGCRIYDDRPFQCRLQECWNPDRFRELSLQRFLTRKDLLGPDDPLWPIIETHERRCAIPPLLEALNRRRRGLAGAEEILREAQRFDEETRRRLQEEYGIQPIFQLFLIGRPLKEVLLAQTFPAGEDSPQPMDLKKEKKEKGLGS